MSEADYMDDCDMFVLADEHAGKSADATHEVQIGGRVAFRGSRAACWDFKRHNGGWVQETDQ